MEHFWEDHWWLLIPLGAFTIPLAGIAMAAFGAWLHFRSRNRALETLKVYAQQGRDPPPELLRALGGGPSDGHWRQRYWADPGAAAGSAGAEAAGAAQDAAAAAAAVAAAMGAQFGGRWSNPDAIRARAEYYTARAAARSARWRARLPLRRWENAIFMSAAAVALYFASYHYAADHLLSGRLYVGAIIVGALAAAAVLSAILATVLRPR